MHKSTIIILFACLASCTHTKTPSGVKEGVISSSVPQEITVKITGDTYDNMENILQPVSYVKLSETPLLGSIKKIQIADERIYVWDIVAGIVCYDMSGKLLYQVNAKGAGPGEYANINAFAVNTRLREFVIYDNMKQVLMFYSAKDGNFLKSEQINKPVPTEISYSDGYFFYHNRLHRNYPNDTALHYYLLSSKDGVHIEKRYFQHLESVEQYTFSPSGQSLYDNYSKLYYCKDFDNTVYQVYGDSVTPRFRINLPQPMPVSKIEDRPNEMELLRSGYSLGISDVYECEELLCFRFVKDGYILSCLYDIEENKQICCAKRIKFLHSPFIAAINGVYKKCFYSILPPEYIDYALSENPSECPDVFKTYNVQEDNPVIAFYKPVRSY